MPYVSNRNQIQHVIFDEGYLQLEGWPFSGYTSLLDVKLPASLTGIGWENPFDDYPSMREIIVPEANKNFTAVNGILYSKDMTILYFYPSCITETTYYLPKTVTHIHYAALTRFKFLKKL